MVVSGVERRHSINNANSPSNSFSRSLHIGDAHRNLRFDRRLYLWCLGDLGENGSGAGDGGDDRRETRGALAGGSGVGGQTSQSSVR